VAEKVAVLALVALERLEVRVMGIMEATERVVARTGIVLLIFYIHHVMDLVLVIMATILVAVVHFKDLLL
jgi:hypothetical protein